MGKDVDLGINFGEDFLFQEHGNVRGLDPRAVAPE